MLSNTYYKNKKIIVTGGAGFIGSNLVEKLVELGAKILVIDDLSTGKPENFPAHIKKEIIFQKTSILNLDQLIELFKGYELVFHLATQCVRLSINNPFIVHEVNTTGTLNVCQAALESNIKKLVYISSSEIYGNSGEELLSESSKVEPSTIYGASKLAGEYYIKAFQEINNLECVIIRPFNTYGPKSHLKGVYGEVIPRFTLQLLNNMSPSIFGDGKQTRDFTYVLETATMILKLATLSNITVNLAYGQAVSINEIAQILAELLDKKHIVPKHLEERPGDVKKLRADITLMKRLIDYTPTVNIKEGLGLYLNWFLKNHKNFSDLLENMPIKNWEINEESVKIKA